MSFLLIYGIAFGTWIGFIDNVPVMNNDKCGINKFIPFYPFSHNAINMAMKGTWFMYVFFFDNSLIDFFTEINWINHTHTYTHILETFFDTNTNVQQQIYFPYHLSKYKQSFRILCEKHLTKKCFFLNGILYLTRVKNMDQTFREN